MPGQTTNLKVLIDVELKRKLDQLLAKKRTSLTDGVEAIATWLIQQDSLLQSIVLGQLDERDQREVIRLVAKRYGMDVVAATPAAPTPAKRRIAISPPPPGEELPDEEPPAVQKPHRRQTQHG